MGMSQRFRRIMKEWAIGFGLLLLLSVVYFVGWIVLDSNRSRSSAFLLALTVFYIAALFILMIVFFRRLERANKPLEYREAQERGLPATAKVLDLQRTRWRIRRSRNFRFRSRPTRWEYQMRLRVSRPDLMDYEATLADFFIADQVPKKGDTLSVKVHPARPDVIVLANPL